MEQIIAQRGFFISYEGKGFDYYPQGGYSHGAASGYGNYDAFVFANYLEKELPIVTDETELVVAWNGDCHVRLYPVQAKEYGIRVFADKIGDENADVLGDGYGFISPQDEYSNLSVMYEGHAGTKSYRISTINGEPAMEYEPIHQIYSWEDKLHSYQQDFYSFKEDEDLVLGIPYGTKLVEYSCSQSVICYYSDPDNINVGEEAMYTPQMTPTVDGYAVLDFSDIPDGEYIMILKDGSKYLGTILKLRYNE